MFLVFRVGLIGCNVWKIEVDFVYGILLKCIDFMLCGLKKEVLIKFYVGLVFSYCNIIYNFL